MSREQQIRTHDDRVRAGRDLVRNAADPQQVKRATRTTDDREARVRDAYRVILASPIGRIVFWDLLSDCHLYASITSDAPRIHELSGRRDVGLKLAATLVDIDEDAFDLMSKEARAYARGEEHAAAAERTPRAHEDDTT